LNLRKTYTIDEAQKKLEYYCSYQERCHQEVRQKLKGMYMIPEAIDTIMVSLIRHDYLNESRFARLFVQGKFRIKKWGKKRLTIELKRRDISAYNIKEALKQISDFEYLEAFHELATKKAGNIKESNSFKKKKKLADYLLIRGWESHLVYEKVHALIN
jgi:regulatory protein